MSVQVALKVTTERVTVVSRARAVRVWTSLTLLRYIGIFSLTKRPQSVRSCNNAPLSWPWYFRPIDSLEPSRDYSSRWRSREFIFTTHVCLEIVNICLRIHCLVEVVSSLHSTLTRLAPSTQEWHNSKIIIPYPLFLERTFLGDPTLYINYKFKWRSRGNHSRTHDFSCITGAKSRQNLFVFVRITLSDKDNH